MKKVKTLRAGIFSEIIIVILPLTALLIFQTVNDITVSDRVASTYQLQTASSAARQKFKLFVNGVVDAVDTGRVSDDAIHHLQLATEELKSVKRGENKTEFGALATKTGTLLSHMRKDRTFQGLLPLRETINDLDAELTALNVRNSEASRAVIQSSIHSAQIRKKIVLTVLVVGLLITVGLITLLIRHIDQFEEALRESEERMRIMFESINAGIVLINSETRTIEDVNPAALCM